MKKQAFSLLLVLKSLLVLAQPQWEQIKNSASFSIHDDALETQPERLSLSVGGWEDGLYISRDGKQLFSTYIPIDLFSWLGDFEPCIDFAPYYRGPLVGLDTVSNPFGCKKYLHSDIIVANRASSDENFSSWQSSPLANATTFDGGFCGVQNGSGTFDFAVFTKDVGSTGQDLYFIDNRDGSGLTMEHSRSILVTNGAEDNPHLERLSDGSLLLFFDRDRSIYFSMSTDNGQSWSTPELVKNTLNDQAPYDVQPHLWNDGADWWVYFSAEDADGIRCIYKAKQTIKGDWHSWGERELVVAPQIVIGDHLGYIYGVGEPTLTAAGDLYFVVVYGDHLSTDTTDVYDCDPWMIKRKEVIKVPLANIPDCKIGLRQSNLRNEMMIAGACQVGQNFRLEIIDLQGQLIQLVLGKIEDEFSVNLSQEISSGLYIYRLKVKEEMMLGRIYLN